MHDCAQLLNPAFYCPNAARAGEEGVSFLRWSLSKTRVISWGKKVLGHPLVKVKQVVSNGRVSALCCTCLNKKSDTQAGVKVCIVNLQSNFHDFCPIETMITLYALQTTTQELITFYVLEFKIMWV